MIRPVQTDKLFNFAGIMLHQNEGRGKDAIFDIAPVDLQEARNAADNESAESRFDFRNVEASFELNDASKPSVLMSPTGHQLLIFCVPSC